MDDRIRIAYEQLRQSLEELEAGNRERGISCVKTAVTLLELVVKEPKALFGKELRDHLITNGQPLCPTCQGTAQVYDSEDEEMMGCPKCHGTGKFKQELLSQPEVPFLPR